MIKKFSRGITIAIIFALSGGLQTGFAKANQQDRRPNVILLVVDDMGYADLPLFGGEVDTPNINNLAASGITFNNFHVLPSCSPTRSVLLSGVDNHLNGLGSMDDRLKLPRAVNQRGQPGYEGYLNFQVVAGPELLQQAGYHTYMAGKWHLAKEAEEGGFVRGTWPIDRGFERSTGVLEGGSDQFGGPSVAGEVFHYFEDDRVLTENFPPPEFYTTKNYTQKIIEYIDSNKDDGKPFFVYWAPNTPHWPHQVPDDYIRKYVERGTYDQGWDVIRQQRFDRMKQLGIIPMTAALPPRVPNAPAWDDPSDPLWQPMLNTVVPFEDVWGIQDLTDLKRTLVKDMAVYTAMIDYIDMEIGNLIGHLKEIGEYENTVFVFFSDNGGDAANLAFLPAFQSTFRNTEIDNRFDNVGRPHSSVSYAQGWAQVSNTPLFSAKLAVGEAGIRSPLIVAYPAAKQMPRNKRSNAFVAVQDILPTVLQYAGVKHPAGTRIKPSEKSCKVPYQGREICPLNGKSMVSLLSGKTEKLYEPQEKVGFELFGTVNKALIKDHWKVLRLGDGVWGKGQAQPWKLFDLRSDPLEMNDLSLRFPGRLRNLVSAYERYERNVGFIPVVEGSAAARSALFPDLVSPDLEDDMYLRHPFD